MKDWNWRAQPDQGIWKFGCAWARPFVSAAPWVTLAMLMAMMAFISNRIAIADSVTFSLPVNDEASEGGVTSAVILLMPAPRGFQHGGESMAFFDDVRYYPSDPASAKSLRDALTLKVSTDRKMPLLIMADSRTGSADILSITKLARDAGFDKVQIAGRRE